MPKAPNTKARAETASTPSAQSLMRQLALQPHPEGGYFSRTYDGRDANQLQTPNGPRPALTSIYYLLTTSSPIGHFHQNTSDILHFWQMGDPITYYLIDPDTRGLTETVLGPNLEADERLQLMVPGGVWKASCLAEDGAHGYGLISEAVSPGFDYADMTLGAAVDLLAQFPEYKTLIPKLSGA